MNSTEALHLNITDQGNNSEVDGTVLPGIDYNLIATYAKLERVRKYLEDTYAYGINPIGILSSVFIILVLRHSSLSSDSAFSFYLPTLAVVDALRLFVLTIVVLAQDFAFKTNWMCRVFSVSAYLTGFLSFFLVVAVSVDRMIAVSWPHKAKIWSTSKNAKIATLCFLIVCTLKAIPFALVYTRQVDFVYCAIEPEYLWLDDILKSLGVIMIVSCLLVIACCTFVTIYKLRKQQQEMQELSGI